MDTASCHDDARDDDGSCRWLPSEDRARSPFTGWGRDHWEATADHILSAVREHTDEGGSLVTGSPRQNSTIGLEGFARAGLLAAYRIAGSDRPSVRDPLLSWLGRGIEAGTDAGRSDAWPRPVDFHQSIVEATWIAIALAETRQDLWDQFSPSTRRQVAAWLGQVHGKAVYRNNWLLCPVIVEAFLEQASGPTAGDATESTLRRIDAMHHRDGWYSDGPGACFDHYAGWGIQLLLAHWVRLTGGDRFPGGADTIRERLTAFLGDYVHLIGADGGPVLQGRSLVYRFAAAAPFWMGALLGASPFPAPVTRRITSGIVRHFVRRGALGDGIPPLGWYGSFPAIADAYSTPMSTLLCSEAFIGLLLPPDHPTWTDTEMAGPADRPVARVLATPGFVCLSTPDGVTRLASHGSSSSDFPHHPGYTRIGYSNRTAPASGTLSHVDIDGHVTIVTPEGALLRRRRSRIVAAADRFASSTWVPEPLPPTGPQRPGARWTKRMARLTRARGRRGPAKRDEQVETASVARVDMELRVTHHWSLDGGVVRDGGLPVSHDVEPTVSHGEGWCAITTADGLTGAVVGLHGYGPAGWSAGVDASPFGRHTVVPYVDGAAGGPETLLVTAHLLTCEPVDPEQIRTATVVEVLSARAVAVHHADGEDHVVQLFRPGPLRVRLPNLDLDGVYRYARSSPDGSTFCMPAF